ncbi:TIGR01777 family oxidoreductase [Flavobacterium sedimenticola]|uniref:TIGR01777 family oxidoreductase n=1 Tax=Flavobacterium sedimenticola TaxID=3043286 RepID=A0ABT6XQ11_9FLAO|nr:TIGR01777 family oxidoreductase [Flavobacterium sedimenticola]MDI9257166.1 TIGR01777 family oxidoreductase [Flavobacterium sedimenticola]
MVILVTGATGLIGCELVKKIHEKNHTVHYLTTSKTKIVNQPHYKGFYWNPSQGKIDENCIYGVDVIIHLAGANIAKRWTSAYKQVIIESRTLSGDLLFNLVKKVPNQVKQIISASGTAIYPESFTVMYDENTTEKEDSFLSHVVQKWEASVNPFRVLGIKVCTLRTGIVLANHGGALPEMVKPIKAGLGAVMGSGKQMQSWIHINDLVALYVYALEHQWEGVYNAVSPNPVNNQQLTKAIAFVLHKPLWLPAVPQFVMKLLLGEMSYLLFSSKYLSAQKALDAGFQFQHPEIKEAIAHLYA